MPSNPNVPIPEDVYTRYRDNLDLAKKRFDAEAKKYVEKMNAYLRGNQFPEPVAKDRTMPQIVTNLMFADLKVMLPVLALRKPRVFVKPVGATEMRPYQNQTTGKPEMRAVQIFRDDMGQEHAVPVLDAAQAQEALANWRWRQLRINVQVRRALTDALVAPFGVVKTGFTMEEETAAPPDPSEEDGIEGVAVEKLTVNQYIKSQSPFAVRWDPRLFRVDPECRYPTLEDAAWVAFGSYERAEDLKRNPKYRNTEDIKATVPLRLEYDTENRDREPTERELFRCLKWEIWDRRTNKLITLVDDHPKVLEYVDWPLQLDGFPAETICLTEYPDQLYGPPDLWHGVGQQDAYNWVTSQIVNHVIRIMRKYVAQRGAFLKTELDKLQEPIDGMVVLSEQAPSGAIMPMPDAVISNDWWQSRIQVRDDHDRVLGTADFVRGQAAKVDTATEASYIQGNVNVRTGDARSLVEDFAGRITKQLLKIDAQTMDLPAIIPIVGSDGVLAMGEFLKIPSKDHLALESSIEIEIGSMQPINMTQRKQDIMQVYGMLRSDPMVDQFKLRRRLVPAFQDSIPDLDQILLTPEQYAAVHEAMGGHTPPPPKVNLSIAGQMSPDLAMQIASEAVPQPPPPPQGQPGAPGAPAGAPGAPAGPVGRPPTPPAPMGGP